MPKDYTQRRNERWETVFPGIGLESILGRILRIARYHNPVSYTHLEKIRNVF